MGNKNNDALLDELIKHAGRHVFIEIANGVPYREEAAELVGDISGLEVRMRKTLEKNSRKQCVKRLMQFTLRTAMCILVIAAVSGIAIMQSRALRNRVYNVVLDELSGSVGISLVQREDTTQEMLTPSYLPEGFVLVETGDYTNPVQRVYKNSTGDYICVVQNNRNEASDESLDEKASQKLLLDGAVAYMFKVEDETLLVILTDKYTIEISGNIAQEELELVALSMLK